jgi:hypothetical protein
MKKHMRPRKGEKTIKEWVYSESERTGDKIDTIYGRVARRTYYKDRITVRKVNGLVGFIKEKKS